MHGSPAQDTRIWGPASLHNRFITLIARQKRPSFFCKKSDSSIGDPEVKVKERPMVVNKWREN
jgi:hypothetical protein